ncbi:CBS domain-containing protein [Actinoplanes sp. NPDC020271]|uniref:CBS domain-containing protein n=1 Tax=Actinoplanes sp. NPDC020271 TaxID=3363896 RepID=UPI00378C9B0D
MKVWHVRDVMTAHVFAVRPDASFRDVAELLVSRSVDAVPVVDGRGSILGVVSESDLLPKLQMPAGTSPDRRRRRTWRRKAAARTAAELMTAPAVVAHLDTSLRDAARRMHEAGVRQLPVEDELDRLAGMVSRGDLLWIQRRPDQQLMAEIRSIVDEGLIGESLASVDAEVNDGSVVLSGRAERRSTAEMLVSAVAAVPGVIETSDQIAYDFDDCATSAGER